MAYPASIPDLVNGLDLSAEDLNLTISPLIDAVGYLKAKLDVYEADGSLTGLRIKNQTLPGSAVVGTVVYHNGTAWALAQAIAFEEGMVQIDPAAFVIGVVEAAGTVLISGKSTALYGGTAGTIQLEPDAVFEAGPYYLSASYAGCLTKNKPNVAVFVGNFFSTFSVVMPSIRDNADAHTHYATPLSNTAAGFVFGDGVGEARTYALYGYKNDADVTDIAPTYATPVICGNFNLSTTLTYTIVASTSGANYLFTWTAGSYSGVLTVAAANIYDVIYTLDGARGVNVFFRRPATEGTAAAFASDQFTTWTIALPTAGLGWIPADSGDNGTQTQPALFDLPDGMVDTAKVPLFIYNIGYDASVNDFYPPTPLTTAAYVFNGAEVWEGTRFKNSSYALTYDTILWVDDTTRPWIHPTEEVGVNEPQSLFCFVRRSSGNTGVVTSLTSATGSPIRVKAKGSSAAATTGDLELELDLALSATDTNAAGFKVCKGFSDNSALMGPVVEKILLGDGLTFVPVQGSPEGQGTVKIARTDAVGEAGPFDNVSLENAKQGKVGMFTYVAIPAKTTVNGPGYAFSANFHIPYKSETPATQYKVKVSGTVFGDRSITDGVEKTCSIDFGYSILPDNLLGTFTKSLSDANTAAVTRTVALTFPVGYTAYDPIKISTDTGEILGENLPADGEMDVYLDDYIYVSPGFSVGIKFAAGTGSADYTGNVGFLNLRWELVKIVV